jgi:DNA topoisomerase-3
MELVIAEKPSVAQSIAAVLGATQRKDGYLEGNEYLVSWCVGHLVELAQPESYEEAWKKWSYESLPIIPQEWQHASCWDTGLSLFDEMNNKCTSFCQSRRAARSYNHK